MSCLELGFKGCYRCIDGFFSNQGMCERCFQGCRKCTINNDKKECLSCQDGFTLKQGACLNVEALVLNPASLTAPKAISNIPLQLSVTDQEWAVQIYFLASPVSSVISVNQAYFPITFQDRNGVQLQLKLQYNSNPAQGNFAVYFTLGSMQALNYKIGSWTRLLLKSASNNADISFSVDSQEATGPNPFTDNPETLELGFAHDSASNLVYYVRELRAWSNQNHLNNYVCKSYDSVTMSTLGLRSAFPMQIDPNYPDQRFIHDAINHPVSILVPLASPHTLITQVLSKQPLSGFGSQLFLSSMRQSCNLCSPGCERCESIVRCQLCKPGYTPMHNFCLKNVALRPQIFSFISQYPFGLKRQISYINYKVITEFERNLQNPLITLSTPIISLPNGITKPLELGYDDLFTLPLISSAPYPTYSSQVSATLSVSSTSYSLNDIISLTVTQYSITDIDPTHLLAAQMLNALASRNKAPITTPNQCNCSDEGVCDSSSLQCKCNQGYSGPHCVYLRTFLNTLETKTNEVLAHYDDSLPTLDKLKVLKDLDLLSSNSQLLNLNVDVVLRLTHAVLYSYQLDSHSNLLSALNITSNIASLLQQEQLDIFHETMNLISKNLLLFYDATSVSTIDSEYINMQIFLLNEAQFNYINFKKSLVSLPPNSFKSLTKPRLLLTEFKIPFYSHFVPTDYSLITQTIAATLYDDLEPVHQLAAPFTLYLPLENAQTLIKSIYTQDGTPILEAKPQYLDKLKCSFWDGNDLSSEGCKVQDIAIQHLICECSHMTDFMGMFYKGYDVLKNSNYNILAAARDLSWEDILKNIGVRFVAGYWITFIALIVLFYFIDRRLVHSHFFQLLYKGISDFKKAPDQNQGNTLRAFMNDSNSHNQIRHDSRVNSRPDSQRSHRSSHPNSRPESPIDINRSGPTQKVSTFALIQSRNHNRRANTVYTTSTEVNKLTVRSVKVVKSRSARIRQKLGGLEGSCCSKFFTVLCSEISNNNLPFNLVTRNSALTPRAVRLSVLFLAVLIQVSVCAFFFNIEPSPEGDVPFFWEGVIENVWIALFSVVITSPPLLIAGCIWSFPQTTRRRLQNAHSYYELQQYYKREQSGIRCRVGCGFLFFFLINFFLSFYLICFCHVASAQMSRDWIRSSLISLVLDQIFFQVLPAITVAALAALGSCGCRCVLYMLVCLEIYRLYRNISDP